MGGPQNRSTPNGISPNGISPIGSTQVEAPKMKAPNREHPKREHLNGIPPTPTPQPGAPNPQHPTQQHPTGIIPNLRTSMASHQHQHPNQEHPTHKTQPNSTQPWHPNPHLPEEVPVVVDGGGQPPRLGEAVEVGVHLLLRQLPQRILDPRPRSRQDGLHQLRGHRGRQEVWVRSPPQNWEQGPGGRGDMHDTSLHILGGGGCWSLLLKWFLRSFLGVEGGTEHPRGQRGDTETWGWGLTSKSAKERRSSGSQGNWKRKM